LLKSFSAQIASFLSRRPTSLQHFNAPLLFKSHAQLF